MNAVFDHDSTFKLTCHRKTKSAELLFTDLIDEDESITISLPLNKLKEIKDCIDECLEHIGE